MRKKEFVLSKQLLRSGTRVGEMVCESEDSERKTDFEQKRSIAYWKRTNNVRAF